MMAAVEHSLYARVDLQALCAGVGRGIDFAAAAAELLAFYEEIDARNGRNTADLCLPCQRGCASCCHESVFLTPLEFMVAWAYAQEHLDAPTLDAVVAAGLSIYEAEQERIVALDAPPPDGARDHFAIAGQLRFRCPLLGPEGACLVYPVRELYARLFGQSFNAQGGVYGCDLVGTHLAGRTVTLVSAERAAARLVEMPFGHKRQVYPYYLHLLYA